MRLVQIESAEGRRVALVEEPNLRLLDRCTSIYDLATQALHDEISLSAAIDRRRSDQRIDYAPVYEGASDWHLLPSADFPTDTARCLVSGTGLTHQASAKNRDAMHSGTQAITDSTRMYLSGVEGGKPAAGEAGISPEWFYKGAGGVLRAHGEPLVVPEFADDGGEEPEIAGVYIIDNEGAPRRIGFTIGNEFSDHVFEKKNYLYLASSKLRTCSIGPELAIDVEFNLIPGEVSIERNRQTIWSSPIETGEANMCHSLANIEHHHFKFDFHRRPRDLHIHFFGADAFSFGAGIRLEDGDVMQVRFDGFGRALRNPIRRVPVSTKATAVKAI
jgi:hypothetical protein